MLKCCQTSFDCEEFDLFRVALGVPELGRLRGPSLFRESFGLRAVQRRKWLLCAAAVPTLRRTQAMQLHQLTIVAGTGLKHSRWHRISHGLVRSLN